ncbi:polyprenyl synthetase family protein [Marinoscillum sp. MHG1-6]|uniref:polyprenyl synthetase family protein n=1 Tax=Marinoscillum sp. MHG1-6 TaxID=2959627 RepID=UPI0021570ABB|nr:polyprenyl synthetase family protein [Marinoscillum sp. MHG1-6]
MSLNLKGIQAPVAAEMEEFEKKFRQSMSSKVVLLDKITRYIVKRKGKQMRPLFVFLCSGSAGTINESTFRGAALIELLHTATLVHDDVVDDSHYRRGFFSINALWKNKIAVLVGDYLLSRGLLMSLENNDFDLLKIVSNAVKEMSEGELLQMEKARKMDITEEVYYQIIRQKTASLITACCRVGAASSGAEAETVEKLTKFGDCVGMAFQIKDDLFDYGAFEIGKPTGIDIKEKKMTLPLIYALSQVEDKEKKRIISLIKKSADKPRNVSEVISFVKGKGGLEYATGVMQKFHSQARGILQTLPDSAYRTSLDQLVQYTIDRTK